MALKKRSLFDYAKLWVCGFIMGAADVVPGVSGGTMAFILGIYDELVESIKTFTSAKCVSMILHCKIKQAWQELPWRFICAVAVGIVSAIIIFSTPIKWLLANRLSYILSFFFGLVLASVLTVLGRVKRWGVSVLFGMVLGAVAGWMIVGLPLLKNPPDSSWYLILCGAVAISAMILPGISGSFILVLLGKYDFVLNAVHELKRGLNLVANLQTMGLFIIGLVVGIAVFIRVLSFLLRKCYNVTIAVLIGFMLGSLRKVWPWKLGNVIDGDNILPVQLNDSFWIAILLGVAGLALVLLIEFIANRSVKHEEK